MTDRSAATDGFFEALRADGPLARHAGGMTLYSALLGDWTLEAIDHEADGSRQTSQGEVHFAWVLEGRAIQDVWIVPSRELRHPDLPPNRGNRYGTTLRVYEPGTGLWHVTWVNPVRGVTNTLVGRKEGARIVQEGRDSEGGLIRWTFSDITADSFHWRGEGSKDGGKTWSLGTEFLGRRRAQPSGPANR